MDEERIRKEKELKRQQLIKEKEDNLNFLSETNFIWGKEDLNEKLVRLPPLICYKNFPTSKPYLTLFDISSYKYPLSKNEFKRKDLLLRFNSKASIVEVESDFHPNYDCEIYRKQLDDQMKIKKQIQEENKRIEHNLEESMLQNYPFGKKVNQKFNQDRFPRIKNPDELGQLEETVSFNELIYKFTKFDLVIKFKSD